MDNEVPVITCSAQEMVFLAGLLGADSLLGVDDPFWGWLANEIEAAWQQAREALAERRFIEIQPDGNVVMDVAVAALMGTCAFPEASFILTYSPASGEPTTRHFYVTRHLAVEQALSGESTSTCRLTALEDARAVFGRVTEIWQLNGQQAASSASGVLPEADLTGARQAVVESGRKAVQKVLQEAGLDAPVAATLAETLVDPVANGALVALTRRETAWEVAGLGLLEGRNGLWRLRAFSRGGENWVEAIPCDAAAACEAIRRVMNRVLPEPLDEILAKVFNLRKERR